MTNNPNYTCTVTLTSSVKYSTAISKKRADDFLLDEYEDEIDEIGKVLKSNLTRGQRIKVANVFRQYVLDTREDY